MNSMRYVSHGCKIGLDAWVCVSRGISIVGYFGSYIVIGVLSFFFGL